LLQILVSRPVSCSRKTRRRCLDLVTSGLSATTSLLELAGLALEVGSLADVRAGGGVGNTWSLSEVAVDDTGLHGATQQDSVLAERLGHSELVEGHALSAGLLNALTGSLGESESADLKSFRGIQHANIVGDGSADHGDLGLLSLHVLSELGHAHRALLDASLAQSVGDNLVEVGLGSASEELVGLDHKLEVRVVTLDVGALGDLLATTGLNIDTHLDSICGLKTIKEEASDILYIS